MSKIAFYMLFLGLVSSPMVHAVEATQQAAVTQVAHEGQFDGLLANSNKAVIVDFWAPWCGPCMRMKPVFEQLASELQGKYTFVGVNIDNAKQLSNKYDVKSIPTFVIIKNNKVVEKITGQVSKEVLQQKLSKY